MGATVHWNSIVIFFPPYSVSRFGEETCHCRKKPGDFERGGQTGQSEHHTPAGEEGEKKPYRPAFTASAFSSSHFTAGLPRRMSWPPLSGATKTSWARWATTCVAWTRRSASRGRRSTRSNWAARWKTGEKKAVHSHASQKCSLFCCCLASRLVS